MKFIKLLSMLLAVLMLVTVLASCNSSSGDSDDTTAETKQSISKTVKINLKIKNGTKIIYQKDDYSYIDKKGDVNPVRLLDWFCDIEEDIPFKFTVDNNITTINQIGDMKAGQADDEYYYFFFWYINGTKMDQDISTYQLKNDDELWIVLDKIEPEKS